MHRFLPTLLLLAIFAQLQPPQSASATEVADLQTQLERKLRVYTPREKQFVADVVNLVQQDQLPLSLVTALMRWASPKRPYPFAYFEKALRLQAAKIGVSIP